MEVVLGVVLYIVKISIRGGKIVVNFIEIEWI